MDMTTHTHDNTVSERLSAVNEEKMVQIPDRLFFRIGEVSELAGVKSYVLRFWEKEFPFLSPVKNSAGQRIYRKSDVENVLLIKRLLYTERYSIEGAKRHIKEMRKSGELKQAKKQRGTMDEDKLNCLKEVRKELVGLIEFVS